MNIRTIFDTCRPNTDALGRPSDVSFIEETRRKFLAESADLDDRSGAPMRFLAEANLTQIIRRDEQHVHVGKARAEFNDRIERIFRDATFDVIWFPEADAEACAAAVVSASHVTRTVDIVNLNAKQFRVELERRSRALNDEWGKLFVDPEEMNRAAQDGLLPACGRLSEFFTTSRSYFGPESDRVLDEQPRAWI